uniref:Small ribosomal subunit protein mS23 n=1 Tax=Elaeophora elaphi TaxID=1147741 RepID=A0A0R3RQI6_9BILA
MAQYLVRKETTGSIFYRVTGLLRSGQLKWKERPLWYDVYVANPPQIEPSADASSPIRKLYYKEDIAMARFYRQFRSLGAINISNEESESLCKKFTDLYKTIEKTWPELSEDEHYQKALVVLNKKLSIKKQEINEKPVS